MFPRKNLILSIIACAALSVAFETTVFVTHSLSTPCSKTTIFTFGHPNTATYGQVITAVAGTTQLDSFSFQQSAQGAR